MRQAPPASSARNVKPRVDVTWEDSTGVSSRMEDVLRSRKRGSEEMGPPDDRSLTPNDELVGISEMAVILMSLGVAPANFEVAELFCRNKFGDAAVSVGFEHGLVNYATGWDMSVEEQMKEVEQRVRHEEPVLLIGSRMCRAFISFASGCTRHSEMRKDCSCMSTRGMRGLVAAVSSMKWRRCLVCTRRTATCVGFSWQRTVSGKDAGSCQIRSASSRS